MGGGPGMLGPGMAPMMGMGGVGMGAPGGMPLMGFGAGGPMLADPLGGAGGGLMGMGGGAMTHAAPSVPAAPAKDPFDFGLLGGGGAGGASNGAHSKPRQAPAPTPAAAPSGGNNFFF